MQRSLFLSSTSLALVLVSACGDDECGPGDATNTGIVASSADVTLVFADITSGRNNDCPSTGAPEGVISLTLEGKQTDGPGLLTLCIGRPDLLQEGSIPLGVSGAQIIDLNGMKDNCSYAYDSTRPVTGTVTSAGLCDYGDNAAGYALTVDGAVSMTRNCGGTMDTIAVTFDGTTAITQKPL